ncbi:hypothetical protein DBB_4540 [Desulfoluna spongiiphila]|nr:hypothetical protein DBB_4540 [Desulfoluna spongiiphila]
MAFCILGRTKSGKACPASLQAAPGAAWNPPSGYRGCLSSSYPQGQWLFCVLARTKSGKACPASLQAAPGEAWNPPPGYRILQFLKCRADPMTRSGPQALTRLQATEYSNSKVPRIPSLMGWPRPQPGTRPTRCVEAASLRSTHRVNGLFVFWAWRSHARLAPQAFRRHRRSRNPPPGY